MRPSRTAGHLPTQGRTFTGQANRASCVRRPAEGLSPRASQVTPTPTPPPPAASCRRGPPRRRASERLVQVQRRAHRRRPDPDRGPLPDPRGRDLPERGATRLRGPDARPPCRLRPHRRRRGRASLARAGWGGAHGRDAGYQFDRTVSKQEANVIETQRWIDIDEDPQKEPDCEHRNQSTRQSGVVQGVRSRVRREARLRPVRGARPTAATRTARPTTSRCTNQPALRSRAGHRGVRRRRTRGSETRFFGSPAMTAPTKIGAGLWRGVLSPTLSRLVPEWHGLASTGERSAVVAIEKLVAQARQVQALKDALAMCIRPMERAGLVACADRCRGSLWPARRSIEEARPD